MFPNGHHRTRHGSVLRMPTKIKHNGQSQTKKELFFFHIPQGLDSTPRHGVNRAASTKTPANWLKEKTHKSKVFHKVEFYSHLRQSYFITEEFCFLWNNAPQKVDCVSPVFLRSPHSAPLGRRGCKSVHWQLPVCSQWERRVCFLVSFSPVWSPGSSLTRFEPQLKPSSVQMIDDSRAHTHTATQSLVVIENELHPRSDASQDTLCCVAWGSP